MSNPVLMHGSRNDRRRMLANEASRRHRDDWGAWESIEYPNGIMSRRGWLGEIRQVRKNKVFAVLIRPHEHGVHLAVSSLSYIRPTWRETHRIKNEILGEEATAVEVYPPNSEVVDGADMFHIWSVDPLPFSLFSARRTPEVKDRQGRR